jgi:UDP-N-acetylmuramoyl-L-alanyl-D-glutamate--2,6-diaminopimelate ligase
MEEYFAAKRMLFAADPGGARILPGVAAVNVDDPYGARLIAELAETPGQPPIGFSPSGAATDLSAHDVEFDATGSRFELRGPGAERRRVELPLPGHFNVENALAALAVAYGLALDLDAAAAALAGADPVPGRMEPIDEGQPFGVLVDYAHTPDSLENVLEAARRLTDRRLICVYGCGGDRDPLKRPLMGRAGAELADVPVVTSDNPRSEDPRAIIEQMLEGIPAERRGELVVDPDRRAAIATALRAAEAGDLVVIAGKGHEQGQEFEGGRKEPFDDRTVAREELAAISPAAGRA